MNAIVIEHVRVEELPLAWRERLARTPNALVTVRIDQEKAPDANQDGVVAADDSLFGMWRDRDDMRDVAGYVRAIRASRFTEEAP